MLTIRDMLIGLQAAGTSEGAQKGWDTRGRAVKSVANNAEGYRLLRSNANHSITYVHPDGHKLTVARDGTWSHWNAFDKKFTKSAGPSALEDHLEFTHGGPERS